MKIKLLKTLMGQFGGNVGDTIDVPNYVANRYIQVGYAERYKPCNCDDCKDGADCPEEVAVVEPIVETAEAKPKKRRRRTIKK
jgi:hypothetical protein